MPVSNELQELRDRTVREIFRVPSWVQASLLGPAAGLLALYMVICGEQPWRRITAAVELLLLIISQATVARQPTWLRAASRTLLSFSVMLISGGLASPLAPGVLIVACSVPLMFERPYARLVTASNIALIWVLAGLRLAHIRWTEPPSFAFSASNAYTILFAACATKLVIAAYCWARRIRNSTEVVVRRSLLARDELLDTHVERAREMNTFSAEMAHELKNPLASIKGLAALMELEPERVGERLCVMKQEVERLHGALDDYLTFSRPMSRLKLEMVDLRGLVLDALDLHEATARAKSVHFETSTLEPIEARCDARKTKQVLVNLVQNAIEASPEGGTVAVTLERSAERVRLTVLDEGPGVPTEKLQKVFAPGVTSKPKAAGLGLTIARLLVKQQQGRVQLRNREGGGLAAEVDLMLMCPHQAARELA